MSVETASDASSVKKASGRNVVRIALLTVLALTLLVFSPICNFQFSSIDDGPNIYLNPHLQYPEAQDIGYFWTHTYYDLYTPATYCVWALGTRLAPLSIPQSLPASHAASSLNPAVFHTFSYVFHVFNALLIFGILLRFGFKAWPCAIGAMLFALHPTQVESVAWITGFNNVLSGFFCLAALYLYLLAAPANSMAFSSESVTPARESTNLTLLTLATLCYAGGLLSKPTATVLPLFVVILEAVVFRRPWRRWIGIVALWLFLAAASFAATLFATHGNIPPFWSPLWSRPFVAGDALSFYLVKLVLPLRLTFDYGRSPKAVLSAWWGYVDWIIPVFVAIILWRLRGQSGGSPETQKLWRCLRVAFLLFVAGLITVLGFVPFYSQPISTVSDRYLYLAMLGPAFAVAALGSNVAARFSRAAGLGAALILLALTTRTVIQEFVWANAYSLTSSLLEESPNSALAQHLAGGILTYQGNYQGALARLMLSKQLEYTEIPATDQDIAFSLVHLGRYAEAVEPLERAITFEPYRIEHWTMLWFVISRLPILDQIQTFLQRRLDINPRDGQAEFTMGVIRMQRENAAAALPELEAGTRDAPGFAEMHADLGAIYEKLNRLPEAQAQYVFALRIDPRNADAKSALAALLNGGQPK